MRMDRWRRWGFGLAMGLGWLMLATPAEARLFETRAEMDKRYGAPKHVGERTIGTTDTLLYSYEGFTIIATVGEHCSRILYIKADTDTVWNEGDVDGAALSEAEVKAVLKGNKGDAEWAILEETDEFIRYERTDKRAVAMYKKAAQHIQIFARYPKPEPAK